MIEDVSHAHGGFFKGRRLGTIGDVAAFSCMSGKSFPIGEGGMLTTDDAQIHDRAIAFAHYERFDETIEEPDLAPYRGLPMGGTKYRMHQMSSAVGRVQLRTYDQRMDGIQRAMNEFWDLLEGVPGEQFAVVRNDFPEGIGIAGNRFAVVGPEPRDAVDMLADVFCDREVPAPLTYVPGRKG